MNDRLDPSDDAAAALPPRAPRRTVMRVAMVAVAALLMGGSAIAAIRHESAPTPQDGVRGFLIDSVVDQNTVVACEYLTPRAKAEIAAARPRDTPCEQGLMGATLTLGGRAISTEAAVKRLRYHTQEHGGRARVTVEADGVTRAFTLRKGTAQFAGPSPAGPWQIDGGVAALVAPQSRPRSSGLR